MEAGMEKNSVNIYDLVKLVHIPEVNQVLRETLEGIENGPLSESVRLYDEKVTGYYRELYVEPVAAELKKSKLAYPLAYWFECAPFASGDWGLTKISPWPTEVDPYFVVLPQDVIDRMKNHPTEPGQVATLKAVYSETSLRTVDLRFARLSPTHICGTVRLNVEGWEQLIANRGIVDEKELMEDPEVAFQAFMYYLHNVPWFAEEFIGEFFKRYKEEAG
jgi:hypothetical protein